jgi:hypothetical protein
VPAPQFGGPLAGGPGPAMNVLGEKLMTRLYRLLAALSLVSLMLAWVSWAQTVPESMKKGSPSKLYNSQTVVTVNGIVVSVSPPPPGSELPYLVYLVMQTETEKIRVFLGPNLYVRKLPAKIKALDRIQVTGSKIDWEGKPVILAAEITKGDQVLKFRRPDGAPYWGGAESH